MGGNLFLVYDVFDIVGAHTERSRYQFWGTRFRVFLLNALVLFFGQFGLRAIPCLLRRRGPAAVLRAIRAVIVNSVKCQPNWFRHKIRHEVSNIMPAGANKNTPTAIPMVLCILRVVAALHHAVPRWVQGMIPQSVFCIRKRRAFYPLLSGFNYSRIAMFIPSQIVHSAHLSGKRRVGALRLRAGVHYASIADKRTYEKSKGVAAK